VARRVKRLARRGKREDAGARIVAGQLTDFAVRVPLMSEERKPGSLPGQPASNEPSASQQSLTDALARLYGTAGSLREAPGGLGDFGHSRTNPVPTASLEASRRYLSRLRRTGGERIVWTHSGTIAAGLNGKPVFQYAILSQAGQSLATLYLSPGYAGTSILAPRGFTLEPESTKG
jgi:hypothetical protein